MGNREWIDKLVRIKRFFEQCQEGTPEMRSVCRGYAADIDGVIGYMLCREMDWEEERIRTQGTYCLAEDAPL